MGNAFYSNFLIAIFDAKIAVYRYFIELSYLGKNYCGWQIQTNANTVQAEVNRALSLILQEDIMTLGAGRTDTGVHASYFVAHFNSKQEINIPSSKSLIHSLNEVLPHDIAIANIFEVNPEAHARFSALSRTYKYYISQKKNPFTIDTSWIFKVDLNIDLMQKASSILLNYTDFTSFSKVGSDVKTNNCKITHAAWQVEGSNLVFTIQADRFLRNMVRAIVGTLVDVGREKISLSDFIEIIERKDRGLAGTSAPAAGLFLMDIEYPDEIFK
ncbi:MAG: tRNA pseudouridine(38-40) synthase TruA [Tenuifilaceae bacterium]|jgi:tRNA pseudouridine38-40 synthase|nr:tRNA pseudouridine(38-40) synthase TruA [Tenuifilaceae bacterium]